MKFQQTMTARERFQSKIQKTDSCWIWIGAHDRYGHFFYNGTVIGAHRAAWLLSNGEIPKGQSVLHQCDNPLCVRPDHLFLGSNTDNLRDMMIKERGPSPFTALQIQEIRRLRASGVWLIVIARKFGASTSGIFGICSRRTWKHL